MGRAFQCGMPLGAVSCEGVAWESGGSRGVGVGGVPSTRWSLAVRSAPSVSAPWVIVVIQERQIQKAGLQRFWLEQ